MKHRIVLIDDDHGPMAYFVAALKMKDVEVQQIDSVDEVFTWLDNLPAEKPQLFIVDMMMPPGTHFTLAETDDGLRTGVFVVRRLREVLADVPILVLTNYNDDHLRKELPADVGKVSKYQVSPFEFADQAMKHIG